jgi:hypothetical protein
VVGFHYAKVEDKMQFTIQVRLFKMPVVQYIGTSSFILSATHYKNGFQEEKDT